MHEFWTLLRLCLVTKKIEGKRLKERRKKENVRKIKIRFKVNKLFLYAISNSFHIFFSLLCKDYNFKMHKFLNNFNYILFSFIFFIHKSNMRKSFSLIFFFPWYFLGTKHNLNHWQMLWLTADVKERVPKFQLSWLQIDQLTEFRWFWTNYIA